MSHQIIFRTIILLVLSSFLLNSCQEQDDLYGNNPSDYAPGTEGAQYFDQKEAACVDAKRPFASDLSNGWINVGLVYEYKGTTYQTPKTDVIYANFRYSYETPNGGIATVSLVNRLGYSTKLSLHPCNAKESYFYIADYSDAGSVAGVLAFSITEASRPGAVDLGREASLINNSEYKIIGLTVARNQVGVASIATKLGDIPYLAYLIRNKGVKEIQNPPGTFDNREFDGNPISTITNGVTVVGYETKAFNIDGLVSAYRGYNSTKPYIILRDSKVRDARGNQSVVMYAEKPYSGGGTYLPVTVYMGRLPIHSFSAWIGTNVTSLYRVTNGRVLVRL